MKEFSKHLHNKNIGKVYFARMEGLANIRDLKTLQDKLRLLTTDWLHEGFNKGDVKAYLINYINKI